MTRLIFFKMTFTQLRRGKGMWNRSGKKPFLLSVWPDVEKWAWIACHLQSQIESWCMPFAPDVCDCPFCLDLDSAGWSYCFFVHRCPNSGTVIWKSRTLSLALLEQAWSDKHAFSDYWCLRMPPAKPLPLNSFRLYPAGHRGSLFQGFGENTRKLLCAKSLTTQIPFVGGPRVSETI